MPLLKTTEVDLYYEIAGQGPPIVMIQGVGAGGEAWRPQINDLAASYTTLLFDNRGFGRSQPCRGPITIEAMASDARQLMDAAGWRSAHVMGHSMGGVIAQQLALDCPKRARSLSLLCTFARAKLAARLTPWVLWMTLRTRIGSRRSRRRAFLEMLYPADYLRNADLDQLADYVSGLIGRDLSDQPSVVMKQLGALARHDTSSRLGELSGIPTLVISAEHDRIALPRFGQAIADLLPGATFEEWLGAAHGVIMQDAPSLNRRFRTFLDAVENARPAAPGNL